MKKIFDFLLMSMLAICIFGAGNIASVQAAQEVSSGTCGEQLKWRLEEDGTLYIDGTGKMDDYGTGNDAAPWSNCETAVRKAVFSDTVTNIGESAFINCDTLETVELANVDSIWGSAFRNCTSLVNIDLSRVQKIGVWCFNGCTSLENADFSSVTFFWKRCLLGLHSAEKRCVIKNRLRN